MPGKHARLLVRHPPRSSCSAGFSPALLPFPRREVKPPAGAGATGTSPRAVVPSGVSRVSSLARSAGTRSRGISLRFTSRRALRQIPSLEFIRSRTKGSNLENIAPQNPAPHHDHAPLTRPRRSNRAAAHRDRLTAKRNRPPPRRKSRAAQLHPRHRRHSHQYWWIRRFHLLCHSPQNVIPSPPRRTTNLSRHHPSPPLRPPRKIPRARKARGMTSRLNLPFANRFRRPLRIPLCIRPRFDPRFRHRPRRAAAPRRLCAAAPGTKSRAPSNSNQEKRKVASDKRREFQVSGFVGARYIVPGKHAWLPARHPRRSCCSAAILAALLTLRLQFRRDAVFTVADFSGERCSPSLAARIRPRRSRPSGPQNLRRCAPVHVEHPPRYLAATHSTKSYSQELR